MTLSTMHEVSEQMPVSVFDTLTVERVSKPTIIDAERGIWGTRTAIVTRDAQGRVVLETFIEEAK